MDISYNNLGNNGAILLSKGLAGEINLRKLGIVDCKITLQGGEGFFLNLGSNASIQELYIDNNKIGKAINVKIKGGESYIHTFQDFFEVNRCLVKITMSQCELNDGGIKKLCYGLATNNTLRFLDLSNNEIGDDGAQLFAWAF